MAKKHWIYVKDGLSSDPKHRAIMGECIWLFLHLIHVCDWETGIVYDWKDSDGCAEMSMQLPTMRYQRRKLQEAGYITSVPRQHGQDLIIHNWINPRDYSSMVKNPRNHGVNELSLSGIQGDNQGDNQGYNHPSSQINTLPLDSESISLSRKKLSKKNLDDANRKVDGILENEKKAKGKGWSQLPEIYHPLAKAFSESTSLPYSKKQSMDWLATFSDWMDAGYTPTMITKAVTDICAMPNAPAITRPGSLDWKLRDMIVKNFQKAKPESAKVEYEELDQISSARVEHATT